MYLPALLNTFGLFQRFSTLLDSGPDGKDASDFLFRATSAVLHLQRIRDLHSQCVVEYQAFASDLTTRRQRIVLSSPSVVSVANEVPPLLNTMRLMQDMVLPIFARRLNPQPHIPGSLNDATKKLDSYSLPPEIRDLTRTYWDTSGRTVKKYRDLDQHYITVVNHMLFEVSPVPRLRLLLPDNPEVKSADAFTFAEERDAFEYLPMAFQALHDWVEALAQAIGAAPRPVPNKVRVEQLGTLLPAVGGTLALMVDHLVIDNKVALGGTVINQLMDGRLEIGRKQPRHVIVQSESEVEASKAAETPVDSQGAKQAEPETPKADET